MKNSCYVVISSGHRVRIDSEDRGRIDAHSWRVTKGTTGRLRVVTSIRVDGKVRTITLGKFLMNPSKGRQVYPRRSAAELDYRKSNLIICTLKERQRLLPKKRSKTSSVFRGVSLNRRTRKWRAGIEVEGRTINLGDFETENEAAYSYNVAARKYFGHMAYQNPLSGKARRRRD